MKYLIKGKTFNYEKYRKSNTKKLKGKKKLYMYSLFFLSLSPVINNTMGMFLGIVYLCLCGAVWFKGGERDAKYPSVFFFISVIFTPIIGAIIMLLATKKNIRY